MKLIDKALQSDKREALSKAVKLTLPEEYPYVLDFDDSYVYFDIYTLGSYQEYRASYTYDDTTAVVSEDKDTVVRKSEYVVVEETLTKTSVLSILKEFVGVKGNSLPVIKQLNDEQMIAIEPLYIAAGDVDLHGDTVDLETTYGMVESLNKAISDGVLQSSLFHKHKTECFTITKAWVNPVACTIGEVVVPEGQPLAEVQFNSESAWNLRKSGDFMGLSIGAQGVGIDHE